MIPMLVRRSLLKGNVGGNNRVIWGPQPTFNPCDNVIWDDRKKHYHCKLQPGIKPLTAIPHPSFPPTEIYPSRSSPISAHRSIQKFFDEGGMRARCRVPGIRSARAPINKRWAQRVDCEIRDFDTGPISYKQLGIAPFGLWVKLKWKVSRSAPSAF